MMHTNKDIVAIAQRVRALSQNGLAYSHNEYDTERYEELLQLSNQLTAMATGLDETLIAASYTWPKEKDYITPKTDIRAVVFNDKEEILLVREQMDGQWSLPGGWADVGFSPKEIAVKEVKEETGLNIRCLRLLAVMDMCKHAHPVIPYYVYKFFILCEVTGGTFTETFDILDKGFFPLDQLPPLSLERVLPEQIRMMYALSKDPASDVWLD